VQPPTEKEVGAGFKERCGMKIFSGGGFENENAYAAEFG